MPTKYHRDSCGGDLPQSNKKVLKKKKETKLYKSPNMSDLLLFNIKISSKSLKQQSSAVVRTEWI